MIGTWRASRAWTGIAALMLTLNLHPFAVQGQGAATEVRGVQMGMEVRIIGHGPTDAVRSAAGQALARIDSLEGILSDWRPGSELSRLAGRPAGEWVTVSRELFAVVSRALEVAAATDGAFDPTVGPLTRLWRHSRRTGAPVDSVALAEARHRTGWRLLDLDTARTAIRFARDGMRLDLGAIAKGWILGEARDAMQRDGINAVLVEAGGDIVVAGAPPGEAGWRIAVATEEGDSVIVVRDAAVATSGASEQWVLDATGARRSHVIDTPSGLGSAAQPTVTVLGRDPATADALATALTLVEPERRTELADRFGVVIVAVKERSEPPEASDRP